MLLTPAPQPTRPVPVNKLIEDAVLNALAYTDGNAVHAAELLKCSRNLIWSRMAAMGLSMGATKGRRAPVR